MECSVESPLQKLGVDLGSLGHGHSDESRNHNRNNEHLHFRSFVELQNSSISPCASHTHTRTQFTNSFLFLDHNGLRWMTGYFQRATALGLITGAQVHKRIDLQHFCIRDGTQRPLQARVAVQRSQIGGLASLSDKLQNFCTCAERGKREQIEWLKWGRAHTHTQDRS